MNSDVDNSREDKESNDVDDSPKKKLVIEYCRKKD